MSENTPQTDQEANRGTPASPKPWPLPVERKGPAAMLALFGLVVLHLLASFPISGAGILDPLWFIPRDQLRYAQIGMLAFWIATGSGGLKARAWSLIPLAVLIWLGAPDGVWQLPLFALISLWMAAIATGVGMIAAPIFRGRKNSQFRVRDMLIALTVYAVLLALLQHLLHASNDVAAMTPRTWQMAQVQISLQGLFIGLCCLPVLAVKGSRLATFACIVPLMILLTAGEMSLYYIVYYDEIPWYLFSTAWPWNRFSAEWGFFLMLIFRLKICVAVIIWLTLFPANYALNLFHRPAES